MPKPQGAGFVYLELDVITKITFGCLTGRQSRSKKAVTTKTFVRQSLQFQLPDFLLGLPFPR
jgi:hypothetical protein